jgi:hypothetical protein
MPRLDARLVFAALVMALLTAAPAMAATLSPQAQAVLALQDRLLQARIPGDPSVSQAHFANEGMYIHSSGRTETKAQHLANIRRAPWTGYTETEREVRVWGDLAVTHALMSVLLGDQRTETVRTTGVYVKTADGWSQVSWQSSIGKFVDPPKTAGN